NGRLQNILSRNRRIRPLRLILMQGPIIFALSMLNSAALRLWLYRLKKPSELYMLERFLHSAEKCNNDHQKNVNQKTTYEKFHHFFAFGDFANHIFPEKQEK